ncbi:MAG: hypothetical protein D6814_06255 [Calditrichaeota bacterium]|nr:MAG: hypothetical protein D6814_06255 [Calditrichota bacterium]
MKYKMALFIFMLLSISCQQTPQEVIEPQQSDRNFSIAKMARMRKPADIALLEEGFRAFVLIEGLTNPEGIDFNFANKKLMVVQATLANILALNKRGQARQFAQIPFTEPPEPILIDVVYDSICGSFTTLYKHGQIFHIDNQGSVTEFASGLDRPAFMARDRDLNLYVAEWGASRVLKFDCMGNRMTLIQGQGEPRWKPQALVFDEPFLYVLETWGRIRRFNIMRDIDFPIPAENGKEIAAIWTGGRKMDLAIGFDGDLFIVAQNDIYRVKLDGTFTTFASGLQGPYNAIQSTFHGDLLVSDWGTGKVIRIVRAR